MRKMKWRSRNEFARRPVERDPGREIVHRVPVISTSAICIEIVGPFPKDTPLLKFAPSAGDGRLRRPGPTTHSSAQLADKQH